jgi:tetratricopeptide (TPR) repeat protein
MKQNRVTKNSGPFLRSSGIIRGLVSFLTGVMLCLSAACSEIPGRADLYSVLAEPGNGQMLTLEPTLIQVGSPDDGNDEDSEEASFQQGLYYFQQENYREAIKYFVAFIAANPTSPLIPVAKYNLAVSYEKAHFADHAIKLYLELIHIGQKVPLVDIRSMMVYAGLARCCEELDQWQCADDIYTYLLTRPDLNQVDLVETTAKQGVARVYLDRYDDALRLIQAAIHQYEALKQKGLDFDNYYLVRAQFALGEIYFRKFLKVPLDGPNLSDTRLSEYLEQKAEYLYFAKEFYLKTIQSSDPFWISAALYRIGLSYDLFYQQIMNATLPANLSAEEKQAYLASLQKEIEGIRERAIGIYRRNLELADDLNIQNEWIEYTRQKLATIQSFQSLPDHEGP